MGIVSIADPVSILIIDLFRLPAYSWFSLRRLCISRNSTTSFRFSSFEGHIVHSILYMWKILFHFLFFFLCSLSFLAPPKAYQFLIIFLSNLSDLSYQFLLLFQNLWALTKAALSGFFFFLAIHVSLKKQEKSQLNNLMYQLNNSMYQLNKLNKE